jgi:hypothetical protein
VNAAIWSPDQWHLNDNRNKKYNKPKLATASDCPYGRKTLIMLCDAYHGMKIKISYIEQGILNKERFHKIKIRGICCFTGLLKNYFKSKMFRETRIMA